MNRNRLLWLIFIGVGMFSNVVSSSNVWAGAPKTAQIVFTAYGRDGNQADIYVMDINGGRQRNLTKHAIADEVHPAWSPDGRKIAFVSGRDGNSNIYVMDADGVKKLPFSLPGRYYARVVSKWSKDCLCFLRRRCRFCHLHHGRGRWRYCTTYYLSSRVSRLVS